jgi:hypothetical protein
VAPSPRAGGAPVTPLAILLRRSASCPRTPLARTARMTKTVTILLLAIAIPATADDSLEDKARMKDAEEHQRPKLDQMNQQCATKVTFSIDWSTLKSVVHDPDAMLTGQAGNYCGTVFERMYSICDKDLGKEAVQKHVSKVICRLAPVGKRSVTLKGGVVDWRFDIKEGDNEHWLERELRKQL